MGESAAREEIELYRIENPNLTSQPDGITSHADLVGQWFSPDINKVSTYLRKSTQTFGQDAHAVDGAQLVVARVPAGELEKYHVSEHPIASKMDVESDNYLLPRDGTIPMEVLPLDEALAELRGKLGNFKNFAEAQQRLRDILKTSKIEHTGKANFYSFFLRQLGNSRLTQRPLNYEMSDYSTYCSTISHVSGRKTKAIVQYSSNPYRFSASNR